MEQLDKYNESFLLGLENACILYKLIGSGIHESPMWFTLNKIIEEDKKYLLFVSSQNYHINFDIEFNDEDEWIIDDMFMDAYNHFKKLKYEYIKKNHPTIYNQIKLSN